MNNKVVYANEATITSTRTGTEVVAAFSLGTASSLY